MKKVLCTFLFRSLVVISVLLGICYQPVYAEVDFGNGNQSKKVTGVVTDKGGEALVGAAVAIKGTTIGTVTDVDGKFSLDVPDNATLVVSFVGYVSSQIAVAGKSVLTITLAEDTKNLDDIVIIGYGTIRKSDLTGSVVSVSSKDFGDRGGTSVGSLLQGKATGVDVTADKIRVRGVTTMNNTDPLYVIDGFIGGDMGTVHPSDIASIEVLKDASATAIYGARGANGVILVTTKKGAKGRPQFELNAFYGIQSPEKLFDMLNSRQYMELLKDIELNGGTKPADLYAKSKLFNPDGTFTSYVLEDRTDWQKEMFSSAPTQEYNLSVRGGTDFSNYNVNMAYNNTESIAGTTQWQNYKISFKGEQQAFKGKWIIGENVRLQHWNNTGISPDVYGGLRMPTYSPITDPDALGGYAYVTTTEDLNDAYNPVTMYNVQDRYEKGLSMMINLTSEIRFTDYLRLNSSFGITGGFSTYKLYQKPYQNGNLVFPDSEMTENSSWWYNPKMENYLTFDKTFGKHMVSAMVGHTVENGARSRFIQIFGKGFLNDNVQNVTAARDKTIQNNSGSHYAYLSYFGRLNYTFNNKYLITANFRADGSPKFGPANRWGKFPSVALGWKLHEEGFMKGISWINQLKLRGSYGITGNDQIPDYMYFSSIHDKSSYAFPSHGFGGVNFNGATIKALATPTIRWEEVKNLAVGLDFTTLNNRLDVSLDYFHKNTYDILFQVPLPPSLGLKVVAWDADAIVNAASCVNDGFEVAASWKDKAGDLSYQIQGNLTYVKNEVTSLGSGLPYNSGPNRTEVGQPIGYFYGYKVDRVYKTQAEVDADNTAAKAKGHDYYDSAATQAGDIRFVDVNGDGKVDADDRTYLGNAIPKLTFGATITLAYKGFDLNTTFTGISGNSIYYTTGYWMEGMVRPFNATTEVLNRWRSESEPGDGKMPRAVKTDPSKNTRTSDRFIYSGTYLRNKLFSIGYTVPKEWVNSISNGNFENIRVYGSVDNLFTITNYPGYNVEQGGDNLGRGKEDGSWPNVRTFRLGVSVAF